MRNVFIGIAMALATCTPVFASDHGDVIAVLQHWADAFGSGSFNTAIAPCAEDAVVIDDLPPHVWQGRGACSEWFKTFETWAASAGVTNARISVGKIRHLDFDGDFAYLVAPVTLSYIQKDKAVKFPGTITISLRKRLDGWRISGLAWADQ